MGFEYAGRCEEGIINGWFCLQLQTLKWSFPVYLSEPLLCVLLKTADNFYKATEFTWLWSYLASVSKRQQQQQNSCFTFETFCVTLKTTLIKISLY